MIGYAGMLVLLVSYVMPKAFILPVQLLASVALLIYAVQIEAYPFIVLNGVIIGIITVRLGSGK